MRSRWMIILVSELSVDPLMVDIDSINTDPDIIPTPFEPQVEEECWPVDITITGSTKEETFRMNPSIVIPKFSDEPIPDQLTSYLTMLGSNGYCSPQHLYYFLGNGGLFTIISEIDLPCRDNDDFVGYVRVEELPENKEELSQLLSDLATNHWRVIWSKIKENNITGSYVRDMSDVIRELLFLSPNEVPEHLVNGHFEV